MTDVLRAPGARPIARPEVGAPTRPFVLPRLPLHVAVMVGLSAGTFGLCLASVTALESASEARVAAERAPIAADIDTLAAGQDRVARSLDVADGAYAGAASAYAALGSRLMSLEASLGNLAGTVTKIDGASRALPAQVALPAVSGSISAAGKPSSHATTGASGAP